MPERSVKDEVLHLPEVIRFPTDAKAKEPQALSLSPKGGSFPQGWYTFNKVLNGKGKAYEVLI